MATYDFPYAQEHLGELFQEALGGEDVIIVRIDGRSCQLLPIANVKQEEPVQAFMLPDLGGEGSLVPA